MIKHLKIHITHVPQQFFKISYITPTIARNLTENPRVPNNNWTIKTWWTFCPKNTIKELHI